MSLLSLQTVTKIFGGLTAVNEVSFDVEQGSIVGLIGPNGAGKTTVFNLITGNYVPDGGDIRFAGQSIKGMKPHTIVGLGIARTFQSIRLFPTLPLVENVLAGRHCRMHSGIIGSMFHTPAQRREERAALERAMNELEFVGLADSYAEEAGSLSYGNQRLLEIARALASDPKLIILDEPTVAVDPQSRNKILEGIQELNRNGATIIYTSHYMEEVEQICTRIAIMDKGKNLAIGTTEELKRMIKKSEIISIDILDLLPAQIAAIRDIKHVYEVTFEHHCLKVLCSGGSHNLPHILNYLQEQNVSFGRVYSELPTLNDVFLEITGKELRD